MDFGKCQDRFGHFFWSKNDSKYLDVNLRVFKKYDDQAFRLVHSLTMGEADFKHFLRSRNQLVIASENFVREENLSPGVIPTLSKEMDYQLKLSPKVVDVVDPANRKICVTLLPFNVDKHESSKAQVHIVARKKEDEKFQQIVSVN